MDLTKIYTLDEAVKEFHLMEVTIKRIINYSKQLVEGKDFKITNNNCILLSEEGIKKIITYQEEEQTLSKVFTLVEAAELSGYAAVTLRKKILYEKEKIGLIEGEDFKKSEKIWLISEMGIAKIKNEKAIKIKNEKINFEEIFTAAEAAKKYKINDTTIVSRFSYKKNLQKYDLKEGRDYKFSGSILLITKRAMDQLYKKGETQ